jgi:hypothetical protein
MIVKDSAAAHYIDTLLLTPPGTDLASAKEVFFMPKLKLLATGRPSENL